MELPPEIQQIYAESQQIPWLLGISGFFLSLVLGIVCLWNPEGLWEIQHAFTVTGGEPSPFYCLCTRILGGVLIAAGIVCLVLTILSNL